MSMRIDSSLRTSAESFGPFRTYLLTRGLVLDFDGGAAVVTGGAGTEIRYPIDYEPNEFGLFERSVYANCLEQVQAEIGVTLVGFVGSPSSEVAFEIGGRAISASMLGEELLGRFITLENLVRSRVIGHANLAEENLMIGLNVCTALEDEISYGKIGPAGLQEAITFYIKAGVPIEEAYFVLNGESIAEDLRNSIAAACHHFHRLNTGIRRINHSKPLMPHMIEHDDEPWEIRMASSAVDELSYALAGSVVASYTALDLLFQFFVYLTREPFLDPTFPAKLHFPDDPKHEFFREGVKELEGDRPAADLPYAIAHLAPGQFGALRNSRNSLVHNMAPDSMRPKAYKGWKQAPVNDQPLQYVQYLARDIDANGKPVAHPWVRRFYENQTDAQELLIEWLELVWQCAFDTTDWLIARWTNQVHSL